MQSTTDFINTRLFVGPPTAKWAEESLSIMPNILSQHQLVSDAIERLYSEDRSLKNAKSRLAFVIEQSGQRREAIKYYAEDFLNGRQTWKFSLLYAKAVALEFGEEEAFKLVEKIYDKFPGAKNCRSGVSWSLHLPTDDYCKLEKHISQDIIEGRSSSEWQLNLALVKVDQNKADEAISIIETAYKSDSDLQDGYSRIGHKIHSDANHRAVIDFYKRDLNIGRLSPAGLIKLHELYASLGDISSCLDLLNNHLDQDSHEYAKAYLQHLRSLGKPNAVKPILPKADSNYLLPTQLWAIYSLIAYRILPELEAIAYIQELYDNSDKDSELFSCVARDAIYQQKSISEIKSLFELDLKSNRISPQSEIQYGEISGEASRIDSGLKKLSSNYKQDTWLTENRDASKGKRCFIIGTGPSIANVDFSVLKNEHTFCTNGSIFAPNIPIKYFVSVSSVFWKHHREAIKSVRCERRFLPRDFQHTLESSTPTTWLNAPKLRSWDFAGSPYPSPAAFSIKASELVCLGGTVVSVCLQLAYWLGYSKVYLLGVDHDYGLTEAKAVAHGGCTVNTKDFVDTHFIKDYYKGGAFHIDMAAMDRAYHLSKHRFESAGKSIHNVTAGSKLQIFPKQKLEDILKEP